MKSDRFVKKTGDNASICLDCFLTIRPQPGQVLPDAEKEHVCDIGLHADFERRLGNI
jgi:hypothetical protein